MNVACIMPRLLLLIVAVLAVFLADSAALAQGGPPGGGRGGRGGRMFGPMGRALDAVTEIREQFQPLLGRRDVVLMRDELGLDEGQVPVVESLVTDYDTRFSEAAEAAQEEQRGLMRQMFQSFMGGSTRERFQESFQKIQADLEQMAVEAGGELPPEMRRQYFREQMQKMSESIQQEREANGEAAQTRAVAAEMVEAAEAWRKERSQMDLEVMDGVKASLKESQVAQWDAFDRFLRREKTLPRGRLSGEGVNLFTVIDEAELPRESVDALKEILDQYEVRLDEALRRRNDYLAQNEVRALKAMQAGDTKEMERIAERMIDLRNAVRNVHEEARQAVVAALPADQGARVERAALSSAYGRVYRPTRANRAFETVMGLADLDPESRKSVEELAALYQTELDAMNQRIAQAIRKSEPERLREEAVRAAGLLYGGGRFFDGPPQDPADELYEKRGEMTDNYVTRLAALLTPEQAAKLPQGTGRDDGRWQGPFGSWTIKDMPEEAREAAKAADKDGNGIIEGDERRELMRGMRGDREGGGGQGDGQRGAGNGGNRGGGTAGN